MHEPELLRVEVAARLMQVGRSTVYEWIAEGLVPTFKLHGVTRIPRAALLNMIEERVAGSGSRAQGGSAQPEGASRG